MPEEVIFLLPLAVMVFGAIYVVRNPHGGNSKKQNDNQNLNISPKRADK